MAGTFRPAARFDADEEKTDNGEQIPGGKVVESGYERVKRRLRSDIVGGAGDDRQAGRADEFGDRERMLELRPSQVD